MPSMVEKIEKLIEYREANNLDFDISVDGGINKETSKVVRKAGADILVAGSAIIKEKDFKKTIEQIKNN